ncbi:MAG: indole-3-glycerol phosphate synthase TrpC [Verrucomicrobia bacterium]|nr:MAG: indole-3-glycerol phosphate synthase TrpC [Verrucomicrobiota bacterium]
MSRNFLSEIVARKRQVVRRLRANSSVETLHRRALEIRKNAVTHRLHQTLNAPSSALKIIAEFKRASPSVGMIQSDLSPADAARLYERGGACAVSVLTDEEHFGGSLNDLSAVRSSTHLPVLRKDFIIDEIQIYEAVTAGADAILLIVAALDDASLGELRKVAEDELGLDALIEVHTSDELRRALNTGAKIIGVNNRDLQTFEVSLSTSERLIAEAPQDSVMISESGLRDPAQLRRLYALGFRGFLIGEQLMRAKNPETALRDLLADAGERQIVSYRTS